MAAVDEDFRFLLDVADRSLAQLRAEVDIAEGRRAQAVGEHIRQTLDAVEERILRSAERFRQTDDPEEREVVPHTLRIALRWLDEMQEASEWISARPDLHLGILHFLDQASHELIGPGVRAVPISDGGYGYSAFSWPFAHILEQLKKQPSGDCPAVVSYPPQEEQSALYCALLVHELGHPTVTENDLLDTVLSATEDDESFDRRFQDAARDLSTKTGASVSRAEESVQAILDNWLTELLCDSIAIHYTGPSYLFAFIPAVLALSWDEFAPTHPPATVRVAFMTRQLNRLGWKGVLKKRLPQITRYLRFVAEAEIRPGPLTERFYLTSIVDLADQVFSTVNQQLGSATFDPKAYGSVEKELRQMFDERILPAQSASGEALDRRSILLAGWMFALDDEPRSLVNALDNGDEFQAFLAAAFEMSFIAETWREA